ncbi:TPA: restriction endonuclease subunit S [Escherichia coli]|uniref:restriction endonuclease subunit S n=1 Tax=Escherichia TaxID=561 RepID=UPI0005AB7854|nr:restriction endonuclease subunit S [Escherichia coli]EEZ7633576.1 restriction endonuclease subunit S [Escherichia coli]EFE8000347.1 restriction endonuclease subunit S [Escherichia coli]EFN8793842.1 restriction endonuclease subunit S [Escherichia coli]EHH6916028.1 restriction endonuclease subunit S [Escherichia coli]EMB4724775.1 restriction endonuclease subunit S [Escherichia coli]
MGSKWEKVRLGDYCIKIGSGATPKGGSSVYTDTGNTYFIRSQNIYNDGFNTNGLVFINDEAAFKLKNVEVQENDVLINITGDSVARVCIAPGSFLPARVNQHVAIIRPKSNEFDSRFLRYFLSSPHQQALLLTLASAGATRHALTKGMIEDLQVPKPPLNIQISIANILEFFDKKIEKNNYQNQTLEKMSQTLFKSWFVDFDPVIDNALDAGNPIPEALQSRAELRQKVRNCADFKPLPAEIRSLFPSEFEETELGWVPKGWSIVRTEDIALKIGMGPFGSNIKVSTFVNAGVPIISGQHLKDPLLIDGDNNFITPEHAEKLKNSAVYRKDIIFTHAGNIGQVSLIPEDSEYDRYIISQRQFFLRVNESKSSPYYLIHYFRSEKGQHALLSNASQVGVPSIARPSTHLKNISFLNPPMVLLKEFEKFSTPLFHRFSKNRKCGVSLTALRDTLLPKLISGELSLEDLPDLTTDTEAA